MQDPSVREQLELAAARFVLRQQPVKDLTWIAVRCIENGIESPALWELAGLVRAEYDEAPPVFLRALSELSIPLPSECAAVIALARELASQIVSGSISPMDGARRIARLTYYLTASSYDDEFHVLDTFIYADSEWPERKDDSLMFEEGVLAAARELSAQ